MNECFDYIRKVKKTRSLACVVSHLEKAETSSEVRGN